MLSVKWPSAARGLGGTWLSGLDFGTAETVHNETVVQAGGGGGASGGDEADAVMEAGAFTSVSEVGALGGSRIGQKDFLPTALLKQHLPAGMGSMRSVPRLMDIEAENDVARLAEYVATICLQDGSCVRDLLLQRADTHGA